MTVLTTERAVVSADGGRVRVRNVEMERVTVTWFCGDSRTFARDDLRAAVEHIDLLGEHGDAWIELVDTRGQSVAVRVIDGELYADTRPTAALGRHVPWRDVKRALRKAVKASKVGSGE